MPKIRISEKSKLPETNGFTASVAFDDEDEFEGLTVHDPLSDENRRKLEWHFEHFVSHPFLNEVEAPEAERIIHALGENLFAQIFGSSQIFARYQKAMADGLADLVIEISGSPEFHALHWEALRDAQLGKTLALEALVLRKNLKPQTLPAEVRETTTLNLLIVSSRPAGRRDVGYRTISRPLIELLRDAKLPVKTHILRPATYESLEEHLRDAGAGFYHAVHFDVHGALLTFDEFEKLTSEKKENNLTFQLERPRRGEIAPYKGKDAFLFLDLYREPEKAHDDGFRADPVRADELAGLLLTFRIPLVILNACQSAKELGGQTSADSLPVAEETSLASRLLQAGAQTVLAMAYSVTVTAAEILMKNLYRQIFSGNDLSKAIRDGRRALANDKKRRAAYNLQIRLEDWLLPVVYQKQKIELKLKSPTSHEEETLRLERAEIGQQPKVEYGFYGRDIDILNIERRVLLKNNILLIRGMGGAGKTTLAKHLAWWWRATGFIEQVFYFGYDEKAHTRQEIMLRIAERFYDKFELAQFQVMDERAQVQKLTQKLRTERHLLILDNLESIQGGYFAIKNTLNETEQAKLKEFLAELRGRADAFSPSTIVLLGSRSPEEWLADTTFGKNIYELGGLDTESATQFAEEILSQNEVLQYRRAPEFKILMKLLAGFPLPMKVVFENLRRQTPAEVVSALKLGGVDLNTGDAEQKTADILKCIEYSHSNIAPEKQELLLCLAPFTSVVNRMYFERYIEELKKHETLAHLRHELWDEVFAESVNRGLMSQPKNLPHFNLQPVLPFFLKTEWQKADRTAFQKAVQTAFRNYFNEVSGLILNLMKSKTADEKRLGQYLASLEFENFDTCLELSLSSHNPIVYPYFVLSYYYDSVRDNQSGLELGNKVLRKIERYSANNWEETKAGALLQVMYDISDRLRLLKKFDESKVSYEKTLEFVHQMKTFEAIPKQDLLAPIYQDLGIVLTELRDFRNAEMYCQKALEIFTDLKNPLSQARVFSNLGLLAGEQNKLEDARNWFHKALEIFEDFEDPIECAKIYISLGKLEQQKNNLESAEDFYNNAKNICIRYDEKELLARIYHNLGTIAESKNEPQIAKEFLTKAISIHVEANDEYSQAVSFHQLGVVAQSEQDLESAERYYKKALEINLKYGDAFSAAVSINNLGNVALKKRKLSEAEILTKQAMRLFEDDEYLRADALNQLGVISQMKGEFDESRKYFLEALKLSQALNDIDKIGLLTLNLFDLWEMTGDENLLDDVINIFQVTSTEVREMFEQIKAKTKDK